MLLFVVKEPVVTGALQSQSQILDDSELGILQMASKRQTTRCVGYC